MNVKKIRILLVCPQTLVCEGLRLLLSQDEDLNVVAAVADLEQMPVELPRWQPNVILAAFGWADHDCLSVVTDFKRERPGLPLLVLSQDVSPKHIQSVLNAGATGYLQMDTHPDDLIRAVNTVAKGELTLSPKVVMALLSHLSNQKGNSPLPELHIFSSREQEVLACLTRGLSDRDIAQQLFVSVRTIQTHLAHIYTKLGVHSRTEAALIAVRAGWFPPSSQNQ